MRSQTREDDWLLITRLPASQRYRIMGFSHRKMAGIVALVTWLGCLGLLWKQSVGAESSRIVDGSNVTYTFIRLPLPANPGSQCERSANSSRGNINCHELWSGPSLE